VEKGILGYVGYECHALLLVLILSPFASYRHIEYLQSGRKNESPVENTTLSVIFAP
jgi:hypothetical protein